MKLEEAIRSGKRFKRPADSEWLDAQNDMEAQEEIFRENNRRYIFYVADLLAEDWEIEEEKLLISRSQLLKAFPYDYRGAVEQVCEILGFKK